MAKKPKSKNNKAGDVEKMPVKLKTIELPDTAKAKVKLIMQGLDTYLDGVAAGLGAKGKWSFDLKKMQFIGPENK